MHMPPAAMKQDECLRVIDMFAIDDCGGGHGVLVAAVTRVRKWARQLFRCQSHRC